MDKLTEQQKKRIASAWERPFAVPKPAPKPLSKKKGRKAKESETNDES